MTSPPSLPPKVRVLGLPVSAVDLEGATAHAAAAVADGKTLRIVVANHSKLWLALRDPVLRSSLEDAELVVAESSVVWAARTLGHKGVGAAWGVVLMERLLDRAGAGGWTVYLLGAREEVNRTLADKVRTRWPGARLVGRHHGYLDGGTEVRVLEELEATAPDLLLVAMGSPAQERLMARLSPAGGPKVRMGVGGSFDVHAGFKSDAPSGVRGSGVEWLWRSLQDPSLLGRYLVRNPWFVAMVLRERWTGRVPEPPG
ncbi:MAG: WecB/TagA/CpsF family glycosyltransferase [Longimicrobiales bacterium]